MKKPELINDEEIEEIDIDCGMTEIDGSQPHYPLKYEHRLLQAQNDKTYKDTLKQFVKWIDNHSIITSKDSLMLPRVSYKRLQSQLEEE